MADEGAGRLIPSVVCPPPAPVMQDGATALLRAMESGADNETLLALLEGGARPTVASAVNTSTFVE